MASAAPQPEPTPDQHGWPDEDPYVLPSRKRAAIERLAGNVVSDPPPPAPAPEDADRSTTTPQQSAGAASRPEAAARIAEALRTVGMFFIHPPLAALLQAFGAHERRRKQRRERVWAEGKGGPRKPPPKQGPTPRKATTFWT